MMFVQVDDLDKVLDMVDQVQTFFERRGLPRFEINCTVTKLNRGCAGQASYQSNTVKISEDFLKAHEEGVIGVTVPHEVCHLYVHKYYPNHKQHHGPEFRRLMNILGLDGDTYHTMKVEGHERRKVTKTRYEYSSSCGKHHKLTKTQHQKMNVGYRFTCKCCNSPIKFTGKVLKIK